MTPKKICWLVALLVMAACDPTEQSTQVRLLNKFPYIVNVDLCSDVSCRRSAFIDRGTRVPPGNTVLENVSVEDVETYFRIDGGGKRLCLKVLLHGRPAKVLTIPMARAYACPKSR